MLIINNDKKKILSFSSHLVKAVGIISPLETADKVVLQVAYMLNTSFNISPKLGNKKV